MPETGCLAVNGGHVDEPVGSLLLSSDAVFCYMQIISFGRKERAEPAARQGRQSTFFQRQDRGHTVSAMEKCKAASP